jgi:hypothetical protein
MKLNPNLSNFCEENDFCEEIVQFQSEYTENPSDENQIKKFHYIRKIMHLYQKKTHPLSDYYQNLIQNLLIIWLALFSDAPDEEDFKFSWALEEEEQLNIAKTLRQQLQI